MTYVAPAEAAIVTPSFFTPTKRRTKKNGETTKADGAAGKDAGAPAGGAKVDG